MYEDVESLPDCPVSPRTLQADVSGSESVKIVFTAFHLDTSPWKKARSTD